MIDKYLDLHGVIILKKDSNFCLCKIRTIILKNAKKKPKNKNKKIEPKIINSFLICRFITSYLYKFRKIINYH